MRQLTRALPALLLAILLTPVIAAEAQDLHPSRRPSPMGLARITLDDTYVKVVYSRPYKRDRDNIFGTAESGALVPYGELWRTGANEATEITLTGDLQVAGQPLAAGTYSLFTTPGPQEWKIHFNSKLGLSGAGIFADGEFTPVDLGPTEALVVTVPAGATAEEVDQFTISFEEVEGGADMVLAWIGTEVRVPIAVAAE